MIRPDTSIKRLPVSELPPDLRAIHEMQSGLAGEAAQVEAFGNHPDLIRWYFNSFYAELFNDEKGNMLVGMRFKELLRLKLSLSHGCFVCNSANIPSTLAAGFSREQVDAVLDPTDEVFSEEEMLVLELGEQFLLQNIDGRLGPDLHGRLARYFSDAEILELGVIAAMLSAWSKVMFTFDIATREDACTIGVQR